MQIVSSILAKGTIKRDLRATAICAECGNCDRCVMAYSEQTDPSSNLGGYWCDEFGYQNKVFGTRFCLGRFGKRSKTKGSSTAWLAEIELNVTIQMDLT